MNGGCLRPVAGTRSVAETKGAVRLCRSHRTLVPHHEVFVVSSRVSHFTLQHLLSV